MEEEEKVQEDLIYTFKVEYTDYQDLERKMEAQGQGTWRALIKKYNFGWDGWNQTTYKAARQCRFRLKMKPKEQNLRFKKKEKD